MTFPTSRRVLPLDHRTFRPDSNGGSTGAVGDVADTWRLDDLFPDRTAFEEEKKRTRERIEDVSRFEGHLGESAGGLADALNTFFSTMKALNRLHAYAAMLSDEDTQVQEHQALRQEIEMLWTDYARAAAFVRPEILSLPTATVESFIAEEAALEPFDHYLRDLIRLRDHVLPPGEERILAEASLLTGGPRTLFGVFQNAELPFPRFQLADGESVRLTPANFARHRTRPDREERYGIFQTYFGAYASFAATLGHNLTQGLKAHVFSARSRKYASCLDAALAAENIPVGVYRNLIRQVRANLPVLHRYLRLRSRALGLSDAAYHDLYCPLAPSPPVRYGVRETQRWVLDSLQPLGREYGRVLHECFASRWIDWHPRRGKRSGAYSSGAAYDVHPFILMNFNEDYESVSTLTHELGHTMHSYFSNHTQPYAKADYSIFVAEVASTFNEALLNRHMLDNAGSRDQRISLLTGYLDGLRGTLFRQTMFAEFELAVHERVERGEAPTGDSLGELYLDLLRRYHGHADGVMTIDPRYAIEWAAIPHFYYNFYVYQYATGIVASTALARAVLDGDAGARDRYLRFLRSGGSAYSLDLLRDAGVDLERPEPYAATFAVMNEMLDRLEPLLDGEKPASDS